MRLADENYFRLARLLSCRTVEYIGRIKNDTINSCDPSSTKEFSIQNTLQAQKWLYDHQHPMNYCNTSTPDSYFSPLTNCSIPSKVDNNQTILIRADIRHWYNPIVPPIFQNRTFNWYRSQLLLYVTRYKPDTLSHVQNTIAKYFKLHHPYIGMYVRRTDKVTTGEMRRAYRLKEYFDLFDGDARRAKIRSVYINSDGTNVFNEFAEINKEKRDYYNLLTINSTRNVNMYIFTKITNEARRTLVLGFLTDFFIQVNADLHAGTLTSNLCRMVDGIRLALGKTITFYTPENTFSLDYEEHIQKMSLPKNQ